VRRDVFVTVLLTSVVVFAGAKGCSGDRPASASIHQPAVDLASDTVSGCLRGAALAKVLIALRLEGDRCVPEVTPASVCVAPGGVVRFKIENGCPLRDPSRPPVEIGPTEFKRRLDGTTDKITPPDVFNCSYGISQPKEAMSRHHVIHCDVDERATPGFYKYGLKGIVSLDPDVEIHP
jgi:hypothetical protein